MKSTNGYRRKLRILKRDKALSLIGLAKRANKLVSGEFSTEQAIRSGKAHLVILGEDASDNTKKKFQNMCTYRKVPLFFYSKKEDLGKAVGKEVRASIALLDESFSDAIMKLLSQ